MSVYIMHTMHKFRGLFLNFAIFSLEVASTHAILTVYVWVETILTRSYG